MLPADPSEAIPSTLRARDGWPMGGQWVAQVLEVLDVLKQGPQHGFAVNFGAHVIVISSVLKVFDSHGMVVECS